jgi:3-methyladenine DNA glycosylase AlkD
VRRTQATDGDDEWARAVVAATVGALEPLADAERAVPMARYLRDQFRFLGIGMPARTAALRAAWQPLPRPTTAGLALAVEALWALPAREYRYAGCDALTRWLATAGPELLAGRDLTGGPVERLITTDSWWDTVDSLRKAAVGPLVAAHPTLTVVLDRWIESPDRWLARSAIIHQLGYGASTDAERLFDFCARRATDDEFFIAKAIGWALRTYARTAPDAVRAFVAAHPELRPLARREALKHL